MLNCSYKLKEKRRIIYFGSCLVCLLIGFMAGIFLASPRETITVAVKAVPESVPVAKPETISL